ncbi:type IV pilin protein [Pseudoduganella violacea]|uniref:Type IV pilus assembly protein PilE n=1 Tax=Pseudoduganella violacea TaxID=1715466 RepID=A0A7W5BHI0_9BURK|nr:type IV pilin protein [Pseudoduganella violacea]MBB3122310.1 type IV pilus assembly protein PilE [Pseudoduganella violacea]
MRRQGFSLIEMMVALAILAIVAGAALPAWNSAVIRARRIEAQALLLALMQQQERYFTQHNTYIAFSSAASDPAARQFQWWTGRKAETSAYEVEGRACEGEEIRNCIQLVATPGTRRVDARFKDRQCEALTLTSTGLRLASGPALQCWR